MPEIQLVVASTKARLPTWQRPTGNSPGVRIYMVNRGLGATHASAGVHTGFKDSTPMILLIGQVATSVRGREAFQEVEFAEMFAPLNKWTAEISDPAPSRSSCAARSNAPSLGASRSGSAPLPEDVLSKSAAVPDAGIPR
jgi:acetolactate synthase-1/2/3 large subunit